MDGEEPHRTRSTRSAGRYGNRWPGRQARLQASWPPGARRLNSDKRDLISHAGLSRFDKLSALNHPVKVGNHPRAHHYEPQTFARTFAHLSLTSADLT